VKTAGSYQILLVEDNPAEVRLLKEAFHESGDLQDIHVASDGVDALDFLYRRNEHTNKPRPDLILLDINLPKLTGHQVLEQIKEDPDLMQIPVLILTSSESRKDIERAYGNRANAYLQKPSDLPAYFRLIFDLKRFWLECVQLPLVRKVPIVQPDLKSSRSL
jgi:CheY-like chemotaxis protein